MSLLFLRCFVQKLLGKTILRTYWNRIREALDSYLLCEKSFKRNTLEYIYFFIQVTSCFPGIVCIFFVKQNTYVIFELAVIYEYKKLYWSRLFLCKTIRVKRNRFWRHNICVWGYTKLFSKLTKKGKFPVFIFRYSSSRYIKKSLRRLNTEIQSIFVSDESFYTNVKKLFLSHNRNYRYAPQSINVCILLFASWRSSG
jgi:hypothetical protein